MQEPNWDDRKAGEYDMVGLVIEALFGLVFARALVAYLKGRDPLQRDVMVMFSAVVALFAVDVVNRIGWHPPALVVLLADALLLGQPYLTLRVVRAVRAVPDLAYWLALAGWIGSAAIIVVGPIKLAAPFIAAVVLVFAITEGAAAALFAHEAGQRTGSSRARLVLAAAATGLFAAAILAAGAGSVESSGDGIALNVATAIALVSAVGYLLSFMPPNWLCRWWSTRAAHTLMRQLLKAPADETPEETWRRYAQTVREVTSADAAAILLYLPEGDVLEVTTAGLSPGPEGPPPLTGSDQLPPPGRPVTVVADRAGPPDTSLAASYAHRSGARFVTSAALPTRHGHAALFLLSQHRSLFTDDDIELLVELAAQAAALTERGALLAERDRLTTKLSESVQALTAASQAKSDFLASMSHELRTPLNAIIGFSDLMREEEHGEGGLTVPAEWVEHINSSGHHLLLLINDVLDLAKIEAGRVDLHTELLDLAAVVEETVIALRSLSDPKQLCVTLAVPPLRVRADRVRLRQIVTNLIGNAIKFTPRDGRIFVAARRAGREVALTVADTGPGIAPAEQLRVFEEFQQVGDAASRSGGTGLGLALTRRLVQAHGGRIELTSELGHGSRFTVYLPAADSMTVPAVGTADPAVAEPASGILIIEDEPAAAHLLTTYLQSAGYQTTVAPTGELGLAAARTGSPDVILLDILLPGMDGWDVLRELKRDARLRHIPVVIITVVDESEIGLALGAADYFVKPIDRQVLLDWLVRHGMVPPLNSGRTSVLAIDDDPDTLEILDRSLRQEGFSVTFAQNGVDGLKVARKHEFDLIICDLVMPDLDGFDVVAALHDNPSTRNIPVVVLTAHDLSPTDKFRLSGKVLAVMTKDGQAHVALRELASQISDVVGYPVRADRRSGR